MFKNLKSISSIVGIAFLVSCQAEDANSPEVTNEAQLIDETYAVDLESYDDVPVMINNAEYSIEEVLTSAGLFETYQSANTHFLQENLDTEEQVLYILDSEEEVEELQAENQSAKAFATNEVETIDVLLKLYDNNNLGGSVWQWSAIGTENLDSSSYSFTKNVSSARKNKANSYKWTDNSTTNQNTLTLYAGSSQSGASITASTGSNNLSGTLVDNIESIKYEYASR